MWPRPQRSLQAKVGLLLGVVATFAVLALTAVQAYFDSEQIRAQTTSSNLGVVNLVAGRVHSLIVQTHQQLAGFAADPDLRADALNGDAASMNARLELIAPNDPDLTVLAAIDARGVLWATSSLTKGAVGSDFRDQRHVRDVMETAMPSVGDPRLGLTTRLPIVPLGVPIRSREGDIIGILQGSLSLATVSEQLRSLPLGSAGYVELLAADGTILAHPDTSRLLQRSGPPGPAVGLAASGRSASLEITEPEGTALFSAAAPVGTIGWIIHARLPVAEALEPQRERMVRAAGIALLTLVLATTFGVFMARRLIAPIAVLRTATRRMEQGERDLSSPRDPLLLQIKSGDELEELAHDFDSMARRLRESEARYRAVSELTSDFAYAYAVLPDGTLVPEWTTEAFSRITGFTIEEVAARGGWNAFIHPDDRPIGEERRQALFSGRSAVNEFRIVTKSGETRLLRVHGRPVWDEAEGRVVRLYGAGQDVTASKQAEEDLIQARAEARAAQRAEALKTELIAMVSHELRTPLTALQGFSELLLARQPTDEERKLWTRTINEESQRLAEIVDDLLQGSRIEAGAITPHIKPIALGAVIREVVATFAAQTDRHRFAVEDPGGEVVALADAARIRQILKNLISNAVKYSPRGGQIRILLLREGDRARVSVSDEGLGIPPSDVPRLFTRFHRVNAPDRAPIRGTGLGLYITRQLVEMQGGTIQAESREGEGSTFTFTLPLATNEEKTADERR